MISRLGARNIAEVELDRRGIDRPATPEEVQQVLNRYTAPIIKDAKPSVGEPKEYIVADEPAGDYW